MRGKFNFKLGVLCAILGAMLLIPALVQAKDEGEQFKEGKMHLIKGLKLAPEKEKAIMAVEDKYSKERKEIVAAMKKANADLEAAFKSTTVDEAKVKELVNAVTSGQDKLFASFKNQRDEEMALMTPAEQGKYLLALGKWREEMMAKHGKEAGKKK